MFDGVMHIPEQKYRFFETIGILGAYGRTWVVFPDRAAQHLSPKIVNVSLYFGDLTDLKQFLDIFPDTNRYLNGYHAIPATKFFLVQVLCT